MRSPFGSRCQLGNLSHGLRGLNSPAGLDYSRFGLVRMPGSLFFSKSHARAPVFHLVCVFYVLSGAGSIRRLVWLPPATWLFGPYMPSSAPADSQCCPTAFLAAGADVTFLNFVDHTKTNQWSRHGSDLGAPPGVNRMGISGARSSPAPRPPLGGGAKAATWAAPLLTVI